MAGGPGPQLGLPLGLPSGLRPPPHREAHQEAFQLVQLGVRLPWEALHLEAAHHVQLGADLHRQALQHVQLGADLHRQALQTGQMRHHQRPQEAVQPQCGTGAEHGSALN